MKKNCDECNIQLDDNAELGIHLREKHQKHFCGVCKNEFDNLEQLYEHLKISHNITNFKNLF